MGQTLCSLLADITALRSMLSHERHIALSFLRILKSLVRNFLLMDFWLILADGFYLYGMLWLLLLTTWTKSSLNLFRAFWLKLASNVISKVLVSFYCFTILQFMISAILLSCFVSTFPWGVRNFCKCFQIVTESCIWPI